MTRVISEFRRGVIDALRRALEDGEVSISRARQRVTLPLAVLRSWRAGWSVSRIWGDVFGLPERRAAMLRRIADVSVLVEDDPEAARGRVDALAAALGEDDEAVVILRYELLTAGKAELPTLDCEILDAARAWFGDHGWPARDHAVVYLATAIAAFVADYEESVQKAR